MTAEQKARNILRRIGVKEARSFSAGDLVELANLIADHELLKKRVKAAGKLLVRAMYEIPDFTPDFTDGRNDRLCDAIDKWLHDWTQE